MVIPGMATIPAMAMLFRIGESPAETADRCAGLAACRAEAPRASLSSTRSWSAFRSLANRSAASDTAVTLLPRIIPSIGITVCASYQGRTPSESRTETAITKADPTSIAPNASTRIAHRPRACRAPTVWAATASIASAIARTIAG